MIKKKPMLTILIVGVILVIVYTLFYALNSNRGTQDSVLGVRTESPLVVTLQQNNDIYRHGRKDDVVLVFENTGKSEIVLENNKIGGDIGSPFALTENVFQIVDQDNKIVPFHTRTIESLGNTARSRNISESNSNDSIKSTHTSLKPGKENVLKVTIPLGDYYDLDLVNNTYTVSYTANHQSNQHLVNKSLWKVKESRGANVTVSVSGESNFIAMGKAHDSVFFKTIKYGETVDLYSENKNEGLTIELVDLKDGRCPSDVACFWSGAMLGKFKLTNPPNPDYKKGTKFVYMSDLGHSTSTEENSKIDEDYHRIGLSYPSVNKEFISEFTSVDYQQKRYSLRITNVEPGSAPNDKTIPKEKYTFTLKFTLI